MVNAATKSLVIRFIADTTRASTSINTLIAQLRQLSVVGKTSTKNLTRGVMGIATAFTLATFAATAFAVALRGVFHYGQMVENQMVSIELFTGSRAKTEAIMNAARKYSIDTPFTPAEVFGATQQLVQAGIDPYKKGAYGLPKDKMAMDVVGSMGSYTWRGKKLGMEHAIMAMQRGETRMLKPYGPTVLGVHAKALQSGIAGSLPYMQAFIREAGKIPQIMEMARRQSESVSGLWSTVSGYAQDVAIAISGADARKNVITLWSSLKNILFDLRENGGKFMENNLLFFREIGRVIGGGFESIYAMLKVLFKLYSPILLISKEAFVSILSIGGYILRTFAKLAEFTVKVVDKIFEIAGIKEIINETIASLKAFYGWLQAMFVFLDIGIQQTFDKIDKWLENKTRVKAWKWLQNNIGVPLGEGLWNVMEKSHWIAPDKGYDPSSETPENKILKRLGELRKQWRAGNAPQYTINIDGDKRFDSRKAYEDLTGHPYKTRGEQMLEDFMYTGDYPDGKVPELR